MCGIAGAVGPGVGDPGRLARMLATMRHRGPDAEGSHVEPDVMLGCARLAVIDVAGGDQPVMDESGRISVVCNGEIYNFAELRRRLEAAGHRFRTRSDTECLVHLYEEHGAELVHHLRGMFAFAIWDAGEERLLLGRDRVGKKPLYLRRDGPRLWFASELKALLADPTCPRVLDPISLDHYLARLWVPGPRSMIAGVERLPPAHVLTFERGEVSIDRYWRLEYEPKTELSAEEATEELDALLREATRLRLVSERPLGAFLSGGIDSSLVVAAMAELSPAPVKTFTIGFEEPAYDERPYARLVAERFGTDHHEVVVKPSAEVVFDRPTGVYDEPFGDSSAVPTLALARAASEQVTVVLNGDGGDESFAGYGRYAVAQLAERVPVPAAVAVPAQRLLAPALRAGPPGSRRSRLRTGMRFLAARNGREYPYQQPGFTPDERARLCTHDLRSQVEGSEAVDPILAVLRQPGPRNDVDRLLRADVESFLPDDLLVKMDLATMAHSLEARSPLLDQELMAFAARLPEHMKVRRVGRHRVRKFLLKQLAERRLPEEVVRRRKAGFAVPIGTWFRHELREPTHDLLTDGTARRRNLFDPGFVATLLAEHAAGRDRSGALWGLLRFELWCREYVDGIP
jgi:asparagine synthase (glutamine-hydrolysing)